MREEAGLRKRDAVELVDALFEAIGERLAAGIAGAEDGTYAGSDRREWRHVV